MKRHSAAVASFAVFIALWANASSAQQTRDPDAYLRALAAIDHRAALSARAECLSRRSASQSAYNHCLRAAFVTAGGSASAPPIPTFTPSARPERPPPGLDLEELVGPPRPGSTNRVAASPNPSRPVPDCPTFDQCAVQIGAFTSTAIAERELEIVASRFPNLIRPFSTFIRPVTARDGRTVYITMFVDGSRVEAHALCDALKAAGRDCVVR